MQRAPGRPAVSGGAQPVRLVDLPADTLALVFRLLSQESCRGLSSLSSHLRHVSLSHEVACSKMISRQVFLYPKVH